MRDPDPKPVLRTEYSPPAFLIDTVDLDFDIHEPLVTVRSRLAVRRNPAAADLSAPLELDGKHLELVSVKLDGRDLAPTEYTVTDTHLVIAQVPDAFKLAIQVRTDPWKNTRLEGLYASKNGLFTQCEAQGFRCITYFIDRPDVMAKYRVTLRADSVRFPQLLSNGNLDGGGVDPSGRHFALWVDPFPKPSYLFAMVAAKLDALENTHVTRSGKRARLHVYVEPGKLDQAGFAMQALKKAIQWDEEVFGLELDLENFMIVAVGDFNMGAMENKGLNIFNTRYILARPDTATDTDYYLIDKVIAHEYFHNWTGNRVTCRDWFQLSLKEGLTVFRDQEYGADEYSRAVARIQDVRDLRAHQFPEDAGPMAHPVRPDSYIEINNFYTATVYEKGAEVVRMIQTLVGSDGFRQGMDLYIKRHDGQAVTCDDFVKAMEDANSVDLAQFRRWYAQAGTPVLDCSGAFDAEAQAYTLTIRQSCPPTPGQTEKLPFHIPVAVGLLSSDGFDLPLRLEGEDEPGGETRVLPVTEAEQSFRFLDVTEPPVPSILRGFSAPVTLRYAYSEPELTKLMAYDSDPFNRWEAGQVLATRVILAGAAAIGNNRDMEIPVEYTEAVGRVLANAGRDPAFAAECLTLPGESFLAEQVEVADPDAIHAARKRLMRGLAEHYRTRFEGAFRHFSVPGPYSPDAHAAGRRALRNTALAYLMTIDDSTARALTFLELRRAENMTDSLAALEALAGSSGAERDRAVSMFHDKWKDEALVIDKWFRVQATSDLPGTLEKVRALAAHPEFDLKNPNRARSLLHNFAKFNPVHFHAKDGGGYRFIAEHVIALDRLNPQTASGLARTFDRWKKYDAGRQAHARAALESIRAAEGLSGDVREVVDRALA